MKADDIKETLPERLSAEEGRILGQELEGLMRLTELLTKAERVSPLAAGWDVRI